MAAHGPSLFTFGGHLCTGSKRDLPYLYTNQVARLDIAPRTLHEASWSSACRVDAALVLGSEAQQHSSPSAKDL